MRLHDYLEFHAREQPGADFAILGDRRVSYAEADVEANRLANAFADAGLRKGDRFAFLSKNSIEYPIMYYAASKAGVVPVPLNFRLAPPEWTYIVNDSQAKMLISAAEYVEAVDGVRGEMETVGRCIAIDGAGEPDWQDYRAWVDDQPATAPEVDVAESDDFCQMYTSGTSGRPKGAIITHSGVTAQLVQLAPVFSLKRGDRDLIVAPFYHIAAAVTGFAVVNSGACLYIHEDFVPPAVVAALSEERIIATTLVPAMIQACLVFVPDIAERSYDTLETVAYAASPIAEQTLRRAIEVFKCDFVQAYGMTELTGVATVLSKNDHELALDSRSELLLSAGRAALSTQVRIVDEDDNPVAAGAIGEIVVRGPQVMKGYWNLPDETDEALRGGWMHTGDAGIIDEEGYIYIRDRVKDMIVSGGENVYPNVVENTLFQHPSIADVAVIGVPDQQWGETVKALVVLREGETATEEEVIDFCRDKMGGSERPRSVDFVSELPRNATGKVLKRVLREPYWEGHARRVAGA